MSISISEFEKATLDAIARSEEKKKRRFVEALDLIINLKNINLKDPSKRFNNEFELPHEIVKEPKIAFILDGDQLVEARNLKVDAFGKEELEELGKGEKSARRAFAKRYDFFVASQPMMRHVAANLGKTLGPRGKMPRPIPQGYGIIKPDEPIQPSIDRYKKIVRIKLGKFPLIQFKIGNKEMDPKAISENAKAAYDFIEHKMEKGRQNIRSVYVKTTMGPPVRIL